MQYPRISKNGRTEGHGRIVSPVLFLFVFALLAPGLVLAGGVPEKPSAAKTAPPQDLWQRASWESYWYSLYNLSSLQMGKSGMGIRFTPPPEKVMAVLKEAGLEKPPLANPYFVLVPYASGDPHFTARWNAGDGASWRWDPATFDKTVLAGAWAWTAVKDVEWAKHFEGLTKGSSLNHFRALMLYNLAAAGTGWMVQHMRLENGLFAHAWKNGAIGDATPRLNDQWAVLIALSALATAASGSFAWYQAPLPLEKIRALENSLAAAIDRSGLAGGASFGELARGVQALSWFAFTTERSDLRQKAAGYVADFAARIRSAVDSNVSSFSAPEGLSTLQAHALAVAALAQASLVRDKVLNDAAAAAADRKAASAVWKSMNDTLWNEGASLFAPEPGARSYTYTPELVAEVVAAFNAADHVLGVSVEQQYGRFFVAAMDGSGLMPAQLEQTENVNKDTPLPPKAGGEYGQAPVFLTRASYEVSAAAWKVADGRFTTAQAMHLADELLWYGVSAGQPTAGPPAFGMPFVDQAQ